MITKHRAKPRGARDSGTAILAADDAQSFLTATHRERAFVRVKTTQSAPPANRSGHEARTNASEQALTFECEGEVLVGILVVPERPGSLGFVIVPGGPTYRIGAHRQFVQLARRLAASGIATLRFDHRGMGDSSGDLHGFASMTPDTRAAIDALQTRCSAIEHVVLCGLCEGASTALIYCAATRDPRVAGLALLNPWVRSEVTIAKTYLKHYYRERLSNRTFWSKLLRGRVDVARALRSLRQHATSALRGKATDAAAAVAFQDRMAAGLKSFAGPVLLVLSGKDLTAHEFLDYATADPGWRGLLDGINVDRCDLVEADHTFSSAPARAAFESRVLAWLDDRLPART